MAALLLEATNQFFCGGNIITASHVITAAHCIQDKNVDDPFGPSEIAVFLGRYNISRRVELGSETRGLKEIKVHPGWNPREPKYEGDLAVLMLDREVQFSELIQPVCLTVEHEISELEAGYVVCRDLFLQLPNFPISSSFVISRSDGEKVKDLHCMRRFRGKF